MTAKYRTTFIAASLLGAIISAPATGQSPAAAPVANERYEWVTLGTQGGPMPSLERHEPANALIRRGNAILIDTGDGAITQYVGAGGRFPWLSAVFISHLHFDHTAGLFAVLGLRAQTHTEKPLTIYGPPGTKQLVAGLVEATRPGTQSGYGVDGEIEFKGDQNLTVVELTDGASVTVGDITVKAAKNTHYSFAPGSDLDKKYQSLSFRFDLPDRSIVYTGDTGPSKAVEALGKGADMLVSEMIDLDATMANVARRAPDMDPKTRADMATHLRTHHLTTKDIGAMAAAMGVRNVVMTHFAGGTDPQKVSGYASEVQSLFKGDVVVANDLDRF